MASLDGVEGNAHVKVNDDNTHWRGYVLIPAQPRSFAHFWAVEWPIAEVTYEGPVLFKGKYCFGFGPVNIRGIKDDPEALRVEFSSAQEFHSTKELDGPPDDFILES